MLGRSSILLTEDQTRMRVKMTRTSEKVSHIQSETKKNMNMNEVTGDESWTRFFNPYQKL